MLLFSENKEVLHKNGRRAAPHMMAIKTLVKPEVPKHINLTCFLTEEPASVASAGQEVHLVGTVCWQLLLLFKVLFFGVAFRTYCTS